MLIQFACLLWLSLLKLIYWQLFTITFMCTTLVLSAATLLGRLAHDPRLM